MPSRRRAERESEGSEPAKELTTLVLADAPFDADIPATARIS
jgi:hypothetical protein